MATLMERLAFLQKVPTLMKATADDETPCPGYLFEEIGKISHESVGCCQCLLEYLLERLQAESCHVKLKVLKILHHLCSHGSQHFLTELRRNATLIQEATVFSGPPDPIHGNALHQRVRAAAQVLASQLFTDTVSPQPALSPCKAATPTLGMGSESGLSSGMQGFGYSPGKMTSNGGTLLDRIQKAAEVVASAVLPPTEQPGIRLHDNRYRAVVVPLAAVEVAVPACTYSLPSHGSKAQRCPGLAGGGWEDSDSSRSSRDSSQENGHISRASVGSTSKSGTDSQSGASRESGDLPERVEAMHLGDCGQEMTVVSALTEGSKAFLSREETQHFVKECAILNCEVVVELLTRKLQEPSHMIQMRALCAIACLMSSDLLTLDHIYTVTHKWLAQLSVGSPGPVTNKATKLLRQLDALIGSQTGLPKQDAVTSSAAWNRLDDTPKLAGALLLPTDVEETLSLGEESQTPEPPTCPTPADCPPGICSVPSAGLARDECDDGDRPPDECSRSALQDSPGARPSLFSGMELVAGVKPVGDSRTGCLVFPDTLQDSGGGSNTKGTSPAHEPGQSRQQLSAFSFLNA